MSRTTAQGVLEVVLGGGDLEPLLRTVEDMTDSPEERVSTESGSETALVVSCSMSRCEHSEMLWPIEPSVNTLCTGTLGNQTWDRYNGEKVLDGNLAQFVADHDISAALVVGHTRCEVVADAYDHCVVSSGELPPGVETQLAPLVTLAGDAFEAGIVDESTPISTAQYRLVEYNVVRQTSFLRNALPDAVTTVGYVYDQDGVYTAFPGNHYVVTVDDESGPDAPSPLPEETSAQVASLL